MRIVFAGTPELAVPSLRALIDAGHDVVAVITRPDAPVGRGKHVTPSPVAEAADELGIRVLKPTSTSDPELVEELTELAPQACAVVAYGGLLGQQLLDLVPFGWINLHFSLLPAWRGAAPVQRALMAGDNHTGVTTFRLVKALDAGPIFRSLRVSIGDDEDAGELLSRLATLGAAVLVETFVDLGNGVQPVEQDTEGVSLAPKVSVADARIDWTQPHEQIINLVRGTNPDPGAWTQFQHRRFKIVRAAPATQPSAPELAPGELHADRRHVWIGTGSGALELVSVRDAGKKTMSGADWARGAHLEPGMRCGADDHE